MILSSSFLRHNDDIFEALRRGSQSNTLKQKGTGSMSSTGPRPTTNFALTFHSDSDSRNHFRTQMEKTIYKNRQDVTDVFVTMVREYDRLQHEVDQSPHEKFLQLLPIRARNCVANIRSDNLRWFVRLFVTLLLQSVNSSIDVTAAPKRKNGKSKGMLHEEDEPSMHNNTKADAAAARLRLLNRRMSSSGQTNKTIRGVSDRLGLRSGSKYNNNNNNNNNSNNNNNHNNKNKKGKGKKTKGNRRNSGNKNSTYNTNGTNNTNGAYGYQQRRDKVEHAMNVIPDVETLFPQPSQRFFVLFLSHVESSMLHFLLRDTLASMLDKLSRYRMTTTDVNNNDRQDHSEGNVFKN